MHRRTFIAGLAALTAVAALRSLTKPEPASELLITWRGRSGGFNQRGAVEVYAVWIDDKAYYVGDTLEQRGAKLYIKPHASGDEWSYVGEASVVAGLGDP